MREFGFDFIDAGEVALEFRGEGFGELENMPHGNCATGWGDFFLNCI